MPAFKIPDTPAASKICAVVVLKAGTHHRTAMWYYDTTGVYHFNLLNIKGEVLAQTHGTSFYRASAETEILGVTLSDVTWSIKLKELHDDVEVIKVL